MLGGRPPRPPLMKSPKKSAQLSWTMPKKKTRTEYIALLLTPEERKDWESKASAALMKLSQYIRHCVESRAIAHALPTINKHTYLELGRIGTNLNQAVTALNYAKKAGQPLPQLDELSGTIHSLNQKLNSLRLQLLGLAPEVEERVS